MARRLWVYYALHIWIFTCTITSSVLLGHYKKQLRLASTEEDLCAFKHSKLLSCLLFPGLHTQIECLMTEKTQSVVAVKNIDAEWNPQRDGLWISISEISQLCTQSQLRINNNSITLDMVVSTESQSSSIIVNIALAFLVGTFSNTSSSDGGGAGGGQMVEGPGCSTLCTI